MEIELLESEVNPRIFACIRLGMGLIALAKGLALVAFAAPPAALMLPWMALSFSVAIGWHARRAAGVLVALSGILIFQGFYANHLYLLALVLLLVALSDCERHYALRPRGFGMVQGWPLFLMRAQLSIVYFFAGIAKINGEFLSGTTLQYHFSNSVLPVPDLGPVVLLLSVATVASECFIGIGVWFARVRPLAFALVLPLHAVMPLVSQDPSQVAGIAVFTAIMLVLFASFVEAPQAGRLVVWNDQSDAWRGRVSLLRRLDAFGALSFAERSRERRYEAIGARPGGLESALHVFLPGWKIRSGVDAVREVLGVIPGGCFVAPYLTLPGVRRVARNLAMEESPSRISVRSETVMEGPISPLVDR